MPIARGGEIVCRKFRETRNCLQKISENAKLFAENFGKREIVCRKFRETRNCLQKISGNAKLFAENFGKREIV